MIVFVVSTNQLQRAGSDRLRPRDEVEILGELGDDRLFVTNLRVGDVRCLEGRPYSEWLKLEARIAERTDLSPAAMEFYDNFYLPGAQECAIDKQGRMLVPPTLRSSRRSRCECGRCSTRSPQVGPLEL